MKLIDVLNKQCEGKIRVGTKLIIDFSYKQDSPETYIYDGEDFIDEKYYCDVFDNYGAHTETLNAEVKLIDPPLYYLKMPNGVNIMKAWTVENTCKDWKEEKIEDNYKQAKKLGVIE